MKSFVLKLLIFFSFTLLSFFPIDYFISANLKKSKIFASGEYSVWNDIYNGNINADILIFGSSRAFNHINPLILEDSLNRTVYNLGIEGHNFWLQFFRYQEYIKINKKPSAIILSLDLWMLDKRYDLYNLNQFLPYMLFNKDIFKYTSSYKGFKWYEFYVPLIRYIGDRRSINEAFYNVFNKPNETGARIKGYKATEGNWNDDFNNARANLRYWESNPDTATLALFDSFLDNCKKDNIEVILIYSPEYIEGHKFTKNRDEIIELFTTFSKKHNSVFIDYSNDNICNHKENFLNASHLNKKNSLIFTSKLAADLKTHEKIKIYNKYSN